MLSVSAEQLEQLGRRTADGFIKQTREHLRETFSKETADSDDRALEALVERAMERGPDHDVTSEYDLTRFSECLVLYGLEFGETAETRWAQDILTRDDLSGRDKMSAISDYETFELRSVS